MAWTCVVWATSRSAASYTLVWAVTVVRPRCTGTAKPLATGTRLAPTEIAIHHTAERPSAVLLPTSPQRDESPGGKAAS